MLRTSSLKCSRTSASRSAGGIAGKHSSRLRNAMRRRLRATRCATAPRPRPSTASTPSGSRCSSHSRASSTRMPASAMLGRHRARLLV